MDKIKNKTVIITGASGSLGSALALNLARQGAYLALVGRDRGKLFVVAKKCEALGAKVRIFPYDITQEDQCKKMVDLVVKEFGKIDILINNAAASFKKRFDETEEMNSFKYLMDVNYFGSVFCTRYTLPYIKMTKGCIVGICSILGKIVTPGNTGYCGSKFAMAAFFDALRIELKSNDVSVTMVYPGYLAERMAKSKETNQNGLWRRIYSILMISADDCAEKIINAVGQRKRQIIIPFYLYFIIWLYFFMPFFFDSIIILVSKVRAHK